MVCTAFSMSCRLTHSSREWKACSPAKMLGQGSPMNDRREPSVPPRIAVFTGVSPARRTASRRAVSIGIDFKISGPLKCATADPSSVHQHPVGFIAVPVVGAEPVSSPEDLMVECNQPFFLSRQYDLPKGNLHGKRDIQTSVSNDNKRTRLVHSVIRSFYVCALTFPAKCRYTKKK